MNKLFLLIVALVFCVLFPGCATTGDPNCVGLFCFSEEKFKEEQEKREKELARREQEGESLRRERQELEAKIAKAKHDLTAVEEKIADPSSDRSAADLERLLAQKAALEEDIKGLEEDAKVYGM